MGVGVSTEHSLSGVMRFFDWLFGRGPRVLGPDRLFLETEDKRRALVADVKARFGAGEQVWVVAHFPDELARVVAAIEVEIGRVDVRDAEGLRSACAGSGSSKPVVGLVRDLPAENVGAGQAGPVLVADIHPVRRESIRVEEFGEAFGTTVRHYLSLSDPLLRARMAGEGIKELMRSLGLTGSECVESMMITRRVRKAMAELEEMAVAGYPVESAEEWLERNGPRA